MHLVTWWQNYSLLSSLDANLYSRTNKAALTWIGMYVANYDIIVDMKEVALAKMYESTFDSEDELLEFLEYDYKILGDTDAFMVYYYAANIIWVHFLWADNKRKMLKICKQLWAESVQAECLILFDCDDVAKMFGNHSRRVYAWTKEL